MRQDGLFSFRIVSLIKHDSAYWEIWLAVGNLVITKQ
jgi:hypothetical protein